MNKTFFSNTKLQFSEKSKLFETLLKDPEIPLEIFQEAQPHIHLWHTDRLKWPVVYMRHYIPVKAPHMDLTETMDP